MGDLLNSPVPGTDPLRYTLLLSCLVAGPLAAQRTHPSPENLALSATATITRGDTVSGDPVIDQMAARLRALHSTARIGGEEGGGGADFGKIVDVATDPTGRILVLDEQDKTISRWTPTGAPAGRFGRLGGGPLEFRSPAHLAVLDDGTVIVQDRAYGMKRFRWDSVVTYRDTWAPGKNGKSICTDGTGVAKYEPGDDGTAVQVYDRNGRRVRGIGGLYQDVNRFAQHNLTRGLVACLPGGGYATTMWLLPFVRLWRADGTPGRVIRIDDFHALEVTEIDGGLQFRMAEHGDHVAKTLIPLGPDLLLLQLGFEDATSSRDHAEFKEIQSYLISTRTGGGVYLGNSLPLLLPLPNGGFVGWHNDPVPEVVVYR